VRYALPLLVPEGPYRFPAAALAHLPKRQYDTQAWTRGKRAMSCISYKSTRLRNLPRPGTVWSTYRVWASCGLAVGTMAHAKARRRSS